MFIIGFLDVLTVADNVTKQPDFRGQGLFAEALVFAAAAVLGRLLHAVPGEPADRATTGGRNR